MQLERTAFVKPKTVLPWYCLNPIIPGLHPSFNLILYNNIMEFQIYKDRSNLWRWRLLASNNRIIADGSEGYISKQNAIDAVNRIKLNAFVAKITYLNF